MQPKMIDCPGRSRAGHFASREIRLTDHPVDDPGRSCLISASFLADRGYTRVCTRDSAQRTWTISGCTNTGRATRGGNELVTRLSGWE